MHTWEWKGKNNVTRSLNAWAENSPDVTAEIEQGSKYLVLSLICYKIVMDQFWNFNEIEFYIKESRPFDM